jgi:hypothetical protein
MVVVAVVAAAAVEMEMVVKGVDGVPLPLSPLCPLPGILRGGMELPVGVVLVPSSARTLARVVAASAWVLLAWVVVVVVLASVAAVVVVAVLLVLVALALVLGRFGGGRGMWVTPRCQHGPDQWRHLGVAKRLPFLPASTSFMMVGVCTDAPKRGWVGERRRCVFVCRVHWEHGASVDVGMS